MNGITAAILAYVAVQLLIGAWIGRWVRTEEDYLVAGRRLGYTLTTFTVFATWFGAETCIGSAGVFYDEGMGGGGAEPFGYGLCLVLMGLVFAVPLWRLRLTTLGDFFRVRFSPAVERLAVLMIVPGSVLWAAAQIRAFGQVLAVSSGLAVTGTITLAAAVVVLYTMFGGLLADVWTDLIQGVALVVGLVVLAGAVGLEGGITALGAVDPVRLDPFAGGNQGWLDVLESWAIPVFGSVVAAELVARIIAARSPSVARRSSVAAGVFYLAIGLLPVALGLAGATIVPGLEHPEQILPQLAQRYLPAALYALFAGALVSAILSTVDSALLVAASLVSHNLILPLRSGISEAGKVRVARAGVVLFGLLAYGLALSAEGVYALVEEASAFGSAGIFVAIALGLFTRLGGPASALAALLAGSAAWIGGAYVVALPHPYLTSLAAALLAYLSVCGLRPRIARSPA